MTDKGWKYSQLLVGHDEDGYPYHMIVELYPLGDDNEYNTFCKADLQSPEDLQRALSDITRDGINTHFYDSGIFSWCLSSDHYEWDWKKKEFVGPLDESIQDVEKEYEEEIELYKTHGGN